MEKMNIAVLFGGCSPEYGVSLQSAYAVISHINKDIYNPILVGITKEGEWYLFEGDREKIANDSWHNTTDCTPAILSPNPTKHQLLVFEKNAIKEISIQAVFPVLHGKNGEDGTVQGLIELAGIPLVGCGALASALCMDKDRAHKLAQAAGVLVPASFVVDKQDYREKSIEKASKLGYPLFVKPVRAGSSFGISKVENCEELLAAIQLAFEYDCKAIVEQNINGFEVGCAIMGNTQFITGEVDEVELAKGFFNFTEKYTLETSAIHVPARVNYTQAAQIKETAKVIYRALGCTGLARVDMFLTSGGEIYFNEVNTLPGFTTHSRFPNMLKATGMSMEEIVSKAIDLAVTME